MFVAKETRLLLAREIHAMFSSKIHSLLMCMRFINPAQHGVSVKTTNKLTEQ